MGSGVARRDRRLRDQRRRQVVGEIRGRDQRFTSASSAAGFAASASYENSAIPGGVTSRASAICSRSSRRTQPMKWTVRRQERSQNHG